MNLRFACLTCCLGLALFPMAAVAQVTAIQQPGDAKQIASNKLPQREMTLTPAAEPRPALKYHLLTPDDQRTPGNAATFYYRAMVLYGQVPQEKHKTYVDNYERWQHNIHDKATREEVNRWLINFQSALTQLRRAAKREYCDWDLRLKDSRGVATIGFLLPEFQELRGLARVLDLKLRVEIVERRYDDALETLGLGYQLARDAGKPPLLICGLVGVAITQMMNEQLADLIASPNSPNLYWALAELPRPLIDLRPAMEHEMLLPVKLFPLLKDADKAQYTPARWRDEFVDTIRQMGVTFEFQQLSSKDQWKAELFAAALVLRGYPQAKKQLIVRGYDPKRVEEMPAAQVVAIEAWHAYQYIYHEMFKWTRLPFWQAYPRMVEAEKKLSREGYLTVGFSKEILPFASLLMPALQAAALAPIRGERTLAALRTIEAIRMHAAENDGRLPEKLQQITVVPAPINPMTGKELQYRIEGDTALLTLPAPPGRLDPRLGQQYRVRIAAEKKK